jgi:Glycosyl hydrolase family 79 C-terminal beta domain
MDGPFRGRYWVTDVAVVTTVVVVIVVLASLSSRPVGSSSRHPDAIALVDTRAGGDRAIPAGFLGLSLEYQAVEAYAGADPLDVNPVLERLIRNLTPGQAPVLRIGGDSADWTWWPLPGVSRPPGVSFTLTPRWVQITRALASALGAKLILGVNLAVGNPQLAAVEASALIDGLGSGSVQALELGNEPELYGRFAWYRTPSGRTVTARPRGYNFTAFTSDYANLAGVLPHTALAGPAFGDFSWIGYLAQFLAAEPQVGLVTLHRYPLQVCFIRRRSPRYPTITNLLSPAASTGLADSFAASAAIAHARGLPLRIDELNTVACGADPAISKTFASALWALDTMFEMVRFGVDGVNIHTFPGAGYELFRFSRVGGRWRAVVAPEYYGLLMFAQAAPLGSALLPVSGAVGSSIKIWATRARDGGIRVVLINKDLARARLVALRVPGSTGAASLERLQAPSALASTGVTLGGQSLGSQTDTGTLPGPSPSESVSPDRGEYVVSLPAASAALLSLPADHGNSR